MSYAARKDLWVACLIGAAAILMSVGAMVLYVVAVLENSMLLLVPAGILLATAAVILWALGSTAYVIDASKLVIRSGPLRFHLPLEDLEELRYSESWSAPGWSLGWSRHKVGIKCRGRLLWYWISPDEKAGFLRELKRRCPNLKSPAE